ncbi:MAG TPA: hypothetical protein VFN67_31245 [Polyangiales bacterium]|nr:hypothetical protein [Polyangiales bacterium]
MIPVLATLLSFGSVAQAQESGGIVGPNLPPRYPATTCYKLQQEEHACVVVGPSVFDYEHPRLDVIDLNGVGPSLATARGTSTFTRPASTLRATRSSSTCRC